MTKHDWLKNVYTLTHDTAPLTHAQLESVIAATFAEITAGLSQGHEMRLPGFGTFRLKTRVARPGRNPQTGDPIWIEAATRVDFKASSTLKAAIRPKAKAPVKPATAVASKAKKARRAA
jgi:nucleoid DNA-binding protein